MVKTNENLLDLRKDSEIKLIKNYENNGKMPIEFLNKKKIAIKIYWVIKLIPYLFFF